MRALRVFFCGIILLLALQLMQAAPATTSAPTASITTTKTKTFGELWKQGGITMYFIALASMGMATFTVDGFLKLRPRTLSPPDVVETLRNNLQAGNYEMARQTCQSQRCFLTIVLNAGLKRLFRSKEAIDFAIQETALKEGARLRSSITYLSVIGVVSPMIGLTGTVLGMMKAFTSLSARGLADFTGLSGAIGEVLVCTVAGLVVAIPAFIFYYVLKVRAQNAVLEAEEQIYQLLELIPEHSPHDAAVAATATE